MSVLSALLGRAADPALGLVLLAALAGAGAPAARWGRAPRSGSGGRIQVLALGAGLLAAGLAGLALAGLWFRGLVIAAVAAAAAHGARDRLAAWRDPSGGTPSPWRRLWAIPAAWTALFAFLPETETDALLYHLAAPEQVFAAHALIRDRLSHAFRLPLPAEMLFGFAVACGADAPARLLHAAAGFACAGAIVRLSRGRDAAGRPNAGAGGRAAGWLWLMSGWSLMLLSRAKNDLLALGWLAAALLAADDAWRGAPARARRAPLALAWLLFGCALAGKYTYAPAAAVLAGWGWLRYGRRPAALVRALWAAPVAALPLLPWWARNELHFGNPLWFALTGLLPTVDGSAAGLAAFGRAVEAFAAPGTGTGFGALLHVLPRWAATAPALLLAVLAAGRRRADPAARRLAGAAFVLAWALARLGRADRFGLPADLALAVAAGLALTPLLAAPVTRATRAATAVLFIAGLVPGALRLGPVTTEQPLLLGALPPDVYLAARFTTLAEAWRNTAALRPRRLLLAGDMRAYRFRVPVAATLSWGLPPLGWRIAREARDDAEAAKRLRQLGLTHVAYNFVTAFYQKDVHDDFPWSDRQIGLWDRLVRTRFRIVSPATRSDHVNGGFYLYEILRTPGPAPAFVPFLPGAEGMYREVWQAERRQDRRGVDAAFARLFRVAPGVGATHDLRAWHDYAFHRWRAAYDHVRPGIDAGMVDDENWVLYGATALRLGRTAEAERGYLRARELYPYDVDERDRDLAVVLWTRGEELRRAGRWPEAEDAYRSCLRWSAIMRPGPDDAQALALARLRLAETLARLGRPAEALAELDGAGAALPAALRTPEAAAVRRLAGGSRP